MCLIIVWKPFTRTDDHGQSSSVTTSYIAKTTNTCLEEQNQISTVFKFEFWVASGLKITPTEAIKTYLQFISIKKRDYFQAQFL